MNRQILRLALPNIISNISVPLLGLVDIAIAGHLSSPLYIGAIALASSIFSMLFWNFNFLRMGTSGFTAQAYGARNFEEMSGNLLRAILIAIGFGLVIIALQYPIFTAAKHFIYSEAETKTYVARYFYINVWSAPAVLGMFAFNGWMIGMQNAKTPMFVAIFNNILNIILSFSFVFGFGMQIEGIALGTLISQWVSFLLMAFFIRKYYGKVFKYFDKKEAFKTEKFKLFFQVNRDIFIRTLLLVLVTTYFTFTSSKYGDTILAANALLMQFFMFFSYFMDGFSYAGEALTGRFIGARSEKQLKQLIKLLFLWGMAVAILFALIYGLLTMNILQLLTDKEEVIEAALAFRKWTILIPLVSFATFVWDGIFIGATDSKGMRNSMLIAAFVFFIAYYSLYSVLENNALWLAFILYLSFRGLMQTIIFQRNKQNYILLNSDT